ncbi:MAG: hypothetical protein EAZ55_10790 [Cytophagales bacterium]|nr:MAG: hypothetical protein EAZ55_10790 [Cytophagales bacterium]
MEQHIFQVKPLQEPSFFQKLLGQRFQKENFVIEINNLLANQPISSIRVEDVVILAENYGVKTSELVAELGVFYEQFLENCLNDRFLSDEEIQLLKHLKQLLGLNDKVVGDIHLRLTSRVYQQAIKEVMQDKNVSEEEKQFLKNLQANLRIEDDLAEKLYKESSATLMQNIFEEATEDAKLSPEEEEEIRQISDNLHIQISLDRATKMTLDKYKVYWQIENGQMPEFENDEPSIPRKEKVYFKGNIKWYEEMEIGEQTVHSRGGLKAKIGKGDYWKNPTQQKLNVSNIKEWEFVGTGLVYLTNKRILFKLPKQDKILLLNRVMDFHCFANGVKVDKETGHKDIFVEIQGNSDLFAMLLGKAVYDLDF